MRSLKKRWRNRRPAKGETTIRAVVTRKDGTVEDLGVVSRGKINWKPEAR